jgi:hypothetical protein
VISASKRFTPSPCEQKEYKNSMTQNTITHNKQNVSKHDFLQALYPNPPQNLWLEIRCIHPKTGEVRILWVKQHNAKQLESSLQQADKFNDEGFGIYFAPCLRSEQKGNESNASLLPALWIDIDCDDDSQKRDAGLTKLCEFDPKPSIIVDSGGGWHGYWLLDEPFMLSTDAHKSKVSAILKGLFTALDGDEGYVKSVASIMRLPITLNTKAERNNACVQIKDWHPDRRYSLTEFEWLEVKPTSNNHYTPLFSTNGIGHHMLPPRTEQYLASGAFKGDRNQELFAAACQLRDAGYGQSDAKAQLVARYVADGDGTENPKGREKEAKATITSAYKQSPREPISSPKHHARQVVEQLVGQYQITNKPEQPATQEIVEAVEACVHLNPIEWAEQRQKFKTLTGDGLKITDIDRLYRQKRKEIERERQQNYVETESYFINDNRMIYRRDTYKGPIEKTVADWSAQVLHQICQIDDDGKEAHVTTISLQRDEYHKKLDIPGEIFVDDVALRRFIGASAGSQFIVRAGMSKHLVPAIIGLSGEFETRSHYSFMGWKRIDDRWVYLSPTDSITNRGKLADPPSVELDNRLREYGLTASTWEKSLSAFEHMIAVLPEQLAPALLSFALLPIIHRFLPSVAPKPAMHLVGTSGSGKSEIASLMNSLYGNFSRDMPPAQWGDTINTVETLGYPLADALYWVDDYKTIYADDRTFTRFLQSYSRGMGRGRLTREAKVRRERPCRGFILSTGETSIEGEMSVVARMLILEIQPWEHRDPQGEALFKAEKMRQHLSGFTAHFSSWIAGQFAETDFVQGVAEFFTNNVIELSEQLKSKLGKRQANTDRVVRNWAVLMTVYHLLQQFLRDKNSLHILPQWQDVMVETIQTLREERASAVFLDLLGQLLASGQIVIDDNMQHPKEYPSGVQVVGYRDIDGIYLLPEIAHREINKVQPLKFTTQAIGMQLKEDGLLSPGTSNLTVQRRIRGGRVRLWQLNSDILGCDSCDTCDTD